MWYPEIISPELFARKPVHGAHDEDDEQKNTPCNQLVLKKDETTANVANDFKVSKRRIQQLINSIKKQENILF